MLRVNNQSCLVPEEFKDVVKVCYDNYDRTIEETSDFEPSTKKWTSADAWRYQNVKELDGNDYSGILAPKFKLNYFAIFCLFATFVDISDNVNKDEKTRENSKKAKKILLRFAPF